MWSSEKVGFLCQSLLVRTIIFNDYIHLLLDNYSPSNELTVFTSNFAALCSTVTDIDDLLPYFVAEKIISITQQEVIIKKCDTKKDKVSELLSIISGPLKAGDIKGFYTMLRIMRTRGVDATVDLAKKIFTSIDKGPAETVPENVTKG